MGGGAPDAPPLITFQHTRTDMRHIGMRGAAPLLAIALLAANAGAQGRVVTLPREDRPLAGAPAAVYTLGAAEGSEEQMFGAVAGVAFDAAENLYVLDRQNARVMVYGPNGRFLRQIGRRGQGPGELLSAAQVGVAPDGTVVVADVARFGYALFRPDGTFVRNVLTTPWMSMGFGAPLALHRQGIVTPVRPAPAATMAAGGATASDVTPLMLFGFAGGEPRRVFGIPSREAASTSRGSGSSGSRMAVFLSQPVFSPRNLVAVLSNGQMAVSFTTGYTIRLVGLDGQTTHYLQRPIRPRLTTAADREAWLTAERARIASGAGVFSVSAAGRAGPTADEIRRRREELLSSTRFADTVMTLQGLLATPTGRLWVERTGPVAGEPGPLDLITSDGQYLGTTTAMKLPAAISRGGLAAFIERDEDDVEHVVVRRLPAGWR
ncbi:6-bladed beta-propeller [Longimicrobium terrae]|uniref:6-bladed beta-propeller n=2 Tax=Longimicrobium terrae TaxID=1639882 RepID=A0A841GXR4_9BACT|nr:6-bladed beta-propeller [Longimicrobium terrae]MBB6070537.1 hypothetical protein [Longimicrobium terrae]NNC29523.1 6-bladed beta-propeller [Longimicrobium terrae]